MNNLVKVERNQKYGFVVSSRNVSVVVKRRHDNVMRDIEKIIAEGSPQIRGLFIKSEYMASNGKKNKEYLLLKDGVILYLFNFFLLPSYRFQSQKLEVFRFSRYFLNLQSLHF